MGRGFGVTSAVDHSVVAEVTREAERLGYTSFRVNDLPHADGRGSACGDTTPPGVRTILRFGRRRLVPRRAGPAA